MSVIEPMYVEAPDGFKARIGFIQEIHGPGGEQKEVSISLEEARMMVRHYWAVVYDIELEHLVLKQTSSYNTRMHPYAIGRIVALKEVFGEEAFEDIEEAMCNQFIELREKHEEKQKEKTNEG